MREIEDFDRASGAAPAQPPAKKDAPVAKRSSEVAETGEAGAMSRVRWALIAAIGAGVVGFFVGMVLGILPGVDPWGTGIGAALGGALIGLLGGPPKWLR